MTKQEFESLYLNKAVHCDTEEKANHFLALADSFGYKWFNSSQWEIYEKETCYQVTEKAGLMFGNRNYLNLDTYELIEYQLQPKFKVGDKVRVKNALYLDINGLDISGKVGVIERVESSNPIPYGVKFDVGVWLCFLPENYLEKVEEPTYKEETIDDIIEEIKDNQKRITVLLNRLEMKVENK